MLAASEMSLVVGEPAVYTVTVTVLHVIQIEKIAKKERTSYPVLTSVHAHGCMRRRPYRAATADPSAEGQARGTTMDLGYVGQPPANTVGMLMQAMLV